MPAASAMERQTTPTDTTKEPVLVYETLPDEYGLYRRYHRMPDDLEDDRSKAVSEAIMREEVSRLSVLTTTAQQLLLLAQASAKGWARTRYGSPSTPA